ncbi:hypothetical protein Ahy_B10g104894 [Arachis hypogaea]|uniref:Uncharacterized protein n=1 Tax=Arachis hypogaea TaxID=3818 RepID=A0A444X6M7_ARAHY|nr:hypothetical protein Ahy_B10g104894 [Arachis hypogaea]
MRSYRLCPNPAMHKKATGRPVSTRFRNEMDEVERVEKMSGLYKQIGYTRKRCPYQPTEDTEFRGVLSIGCVSHTYQPVDICNNNKQCIT